jgi:hypothetical protein
LGYICAVVGRIPSPQQTENYNIRESIEKRRGTRLSINAFDWRRDGGAVSEIRGVFLDFRVLGYIYPGTGSVQPPPE